MDIIYLTHEANIKEIEKQLSRVYPFVALEVSNLGSIPSLFVKVSKDAKDTWQNGIFYNSHYAIFKVDCDMKLEQITKHHELPKLRKSTVLSVNKLIEKLSVWSKVNV